MKKITISLLGIVAALTLTFNLTHTSPKEIKQSPKILVLYADGNTG